MRKVEGRHAWAFVTVVILVALAVDAVTNGGFLLMPSEEDTSVQVFGRILGDVGSGIGVAVALAQVYQDHLWRFDPWCNIPVLRTYYDGTIEYEEKTGGIAAKSVSIGIEQTISSVTMTLYSDSSQSTTLVGNFSNTNAGQILYYVYSVSPLEVGCSKGGSRLGAAQLRPNVNGELEGNYWTDEGRRGRLYFYRTGRLKKAQSGQERGANGDGQSSVNVGNYDDPSNQIKCLRTLLEGVAKHSGDDFSGTGVVLRNERFDDQCIMPLRSDARIVPDINIFSPEGIGFLLSVARKGGAHHDGFCLVGPQGKLEGTSQYLFPCRSSGLEPDTERGTRSFSALCGSFHEGVDIVGIVSEDKSVAIYENGQCVYDSKSQSPSSSSF